VREQQRANAAWPVHAELLAQVVEEVSVLAADHRRRKPRQVKRPGKPTISGTADDVRPADDVAPAVAAVKGAALNGRGRVVQRCAAPDPAPYS
jgi:hypothetical protein